MSAPSLLALLLLGALPTGELTLLLELGGQPAGTVTLTREGEQYRYVSRHLFAAGERQSERVREGRYVVDAQGRTSTGAIPAGLWLWTRPAIGCVQGLEELDDVEGSQCARAGPDGAIVGTLREVAFSARYGPDGVLSLLELPGARLRRITSEVAVRGSSALLERFAAGLALPEGTGALAWAADRVTGSAPALVIDGGALSPWEEVAARRLSLEVDASFPDKRQGPADFDPSRSTDARGGCLAHARRFVTRAAALGKVTRVVHGLVAHGGALRPHAWVRVGLGPGRTLELDPALGVPVAEATHLVLGESGGGAAGAQLGAAWWAVLNGARRATRTCEAGQTRSGQTAPRADTASRDVCAR